MYYNKHLPEFEAIAKKYIQQDMPSFAEIQANYSIFLANFVLGFDKPMPLSPNIIPVGGLHIKPKPDPLPKVSRHFTFLILFVDLTLCINYMFIYIYVVEM